jgi:hypothetical protein
MIQNEFEKKLVEITRKEDSNKSGNVQKIKNEFEKQK